MRRHTHVLFAIFLALLIDIFFPQPFLFFGIVAVAALFPDIDYVRPGLKKIVVGVVVEHRGVFHSLWMAALCAVLAWLVGPWLAIPFALGYVSHLMLDAVTASGIAWLYPFARTRGPLKTGGLVDGALAVFFLVADVVLLASRIFGIVP